MAITTNMALDLPVVSVTLGPEWASKLNTALTSIDSHDHSTGKGVKITPSGLNINADLTVASNHITNINSARYINNVATLGTGSDIRSTYVVNGDLYYNNAAGTPVQITNGTSVVTPTGGTTNAYVPTSMAANTTILPADTFSYIEVDTTTSVQITLPSAAAVADGRFYLIKDVTGDALTNNITIVRDGSDTINGSGANYVIDREYGYCLLVSDGVSSWGADPQRLQNNRPSFHTATSASPSVDNQYDINVATVNVSETTPGNTSTATNSVYVNSSEDAVWEIGFLTDGGTIDDFANTFRMLSYSTSSTVRNVFASLRILVNSTEITRFVYQMQPGQLVSATYSGATTNMYPPPPPFPIELSSGSNQIQLQVVLDSSTGNDFVAFDARMYAKRMK